MSTARIRPSHQPPVVRGDVVAMADVVWLMMQDTQLARTGLIEADIIGWGRDFNPVPVRVALTRKKSETQTTPEFTPGIVSVIDQTKDFAWVIPGARKVADAVDKTALDSLVEQLVAEFPNIKSC